MTRQTPLWIQSGNYPAALDRMLIGTLWPRGMVDGCAVTTASAMTLNIAAGKIAVPVQGNASVLCVSDAVEQVTLSAAPASGTNRIDLVIAQVRANDIDGGANNDFVFQSVTGAAAASPSAPAVPANALVLAQVYVPGAAASIVQGNITDVRLPPSPWGSAWGRVREVVVTSGVTNITAAGTFDIAGVATSFYAIPGRRYVYDMSIAQHSINVAGQVTPQITDTANAILGQAAIGGGGAPIMQYSQHRVRTPMQTVATAQVVSIKGRMASTSTDVRYTVSAAMPIILTVDDVGPVPGP